MTERVATYETDVLVYCLYAPIGFWYEELGMDEFLDRQYNAIFHSETDGSPRRTMDISF